MIVIYGMKPVMDRFKLKALSECAPHTLVVSNQFELTGWAAESGGSDKLWVYSIARNSKLEHDNEASDGGVADSNIGEAHDK